MKYTHVIALAGASAAIISAAPTPDTLSYDALVTRFGDLPASSSGSGPSTGAPAGSSKTDLKEKTPSASSDTQSHIHHHSTVHHNSFGKGIGKGVHHHKNFAGDKDRLEDAREHRSHRKQTAGGRQDLASKQSIHQHKSDASNAAASQSPQRRSFDEYLYPRFGHGLARTAFGMFRHHGKGMAEGAEIAADNINSGQQRRDLEYMESIEARGTSSATGSGSSAGASTAGSAKADLKESSSLSNTQSPVHHHLNTHHNSFGKGAGKSTGKGIHHHKKTAGDKDQLEDAREHGSHRKQTAGGRQDLASKQSIHLHKSDASNAAASQSPQRRSFDEDLYDFEARDISSASGSASGAGASTPARSAKTDLKEETPSSNTQPSRVHHPNTHHNSFGKGTGKGAHHHRKAAGDKDQLEDAREHGSHRKHTSAGGNQDLTGKRSNHQHKSEDSSAAARQSPQRRSFDDDIYPRFGLGLAKTAFGMFRHGKGVKKGVEMASEHRGGHGNDDGSNQTRDLEEIEIASRDVGFDDEELSARDMELIKLAARSFVDDFELNELD